MKLVVKEYSNTIVEPVKTEYTVVPDSVNSWQKIPMDIIRGKGDLIVGLNDSAPVRLPSGTSGQILSSNPSAQSGLQWITPSASGWGGATVKNKTGATIPAGSIVKVTDNESEPKVELADNTDTGWLYVAMEDISNNASGTVTGAPGNFVIIRLKSGETLHSGDGIAVSSTAGTGENSGAYDELGIAVGDSYIDSGNYYVQAVITNYRAGRTIFKTSLDSPVMDSVEYRLGSKNSLSITLPDNPNADFICGFVFQSSSSWSGMTFNKTVKLTGDSLAHASRYYNVIVWWDGSVWWAKGTQSA